jgi:hypothetical protein
MNWDLVNFYGRAEFFRITAKDFILIQKQQQQQQQQQTIK